MTITLPEWFMWIIAGSTAIGTIAFMILLIYYLFLIFKEK